MITLTPSGEEIAKKTLEKHIILTKMLMALGVDEKTAMEDACRMEHDISDKTWELIKKHADEMSKSTNWFIFLLGRHFYRKKKGLPTGECTCCGNKGKKLVREYHKCCCKK